MSGRFSVCQSACDSATSTEDFLKISYWGRIFLQFHILRFSQTFLALGTDTSLEDIHKFMEMSLRD